MNARKGNIPLFHPHIPKNTIKSLKKVLLGRWISQGPLVNLITFNTEKEILTNMLTIN